jgi:hypothetical protein
MINQLLVGLVAIDAELGRDDHNSTPTSAIGRSWNHLMSELTFEPDSTDGENSNKIKMVMINFILFL